MSLLEAVEHHRAGRLAEALPLYEAVLQAAPDNADAWHLLGNAVFQLGDAPLAVQLIGKATALVANNPVYLLSLGMVQRGAGDLAASLGAYAAVLTLEPDNASAYFGMGNTLQNQGNTDTAAECFAAALARQPDFFEARYNLANLDKAAGRLAQAVAHYRALLAAHPGMAEARHNLGSALHALGDGDAALEAYALALPAGLPETPNNIGNIERERGQLAAAIASYRRALAIFPDYAEALVNLGETLLAAGDTGGGADPFARALALAEAAVASAGVSDGLAETLARANFGLGLVRSWQGDQPAALDCFARALAARPGHVEAAYNQGVIYGLLLQAGPAEDCYRRALALDPQHVASHINLAALLMERDPAEARLHLDVAYARQNVFEKTTPGAGKTVLILFDAGKGNMNLSHLFNERTTNLVDWIVEYAPEGQAARLPAYDLVFNAMGDADVTGAVAPKVNAFLAGCARPVLNRPELVERTARDRLPALLAGLDAAHRAALLVPPVWRVAGAADWPEGLDSLYPLMARPVFAHGGQGLALLGDAQEAASLRAALSTPVYLSHFVDYRSSDGFYRKYRIIFIDRKPYPYHLAIGPQWIVHYYTAEMEAHPWKIAEERAFLEDPAAVLGAAAMAAIAAIGAAMDLDYAGIDFSLMPDGRVLVFEANPTMLVHPVGDDGPLRHKNVFIDRILDDFDELLEKSVGKKAS